MAGVQHVVGVGVLGAHHVGALQVAGGEEHVLVAFSREKKCLLTVELEVFQHLAVSFGLGSLEVEVFHHRDLTVFLLVGEGGETGKSLHFLVQLERVISRMRSENGCTAADGRALDATGTCAAGTFLPFQFACAA